MDSNAGFQALSEKQQRQIFEGRGHWKWEPGCNKEVSWHDIAIDAGFSEMLASHIYKYLSGYAHSGRLSVLQTAQALVNKETEKLIKPSINVMKVLTANMIQEYSRLFSKAQAVLDESGASQFVNKWVEVGRRLDEGLNMVGNKND